jgi:Protein of unknown function (DUF2934)
MTAPRQAAAISKDVISAEESCAFLAPGHPSEARAAAVHELCERLTAIGNYIASGVRLSEIAPLTGGIPPPLTKVLKRALGQVEQADEVLNRYRNLLVKESEMQVDHEQAIRERAFVLWEQDGHPDGKDLEYWLRAEAKILGEPYAGVTDNGKFVGRSLTEPLATRPGKRSSGAP